MNFRKNNVYFLVNKLTQLYKYLPTTIPMQYFTIVDSFKKKRKKDTHQNLEHDGCLEVNLR